MKNLCSVFKNMWKNDVFWLPRPFDKGFGHLNPNLVYFWPKLGDLDPAMPKFYIFMKNLYSVLENMWKSDLVWLSRPLKKVLAIWANFGPLRAKISKIAGETSTFYWSPRLYLPIGIQI